MIFNNAYFLIATYGWLAMIGALFIAGSMNKGPLASENAGTKLTKLVIGIPSLALGLILAGGHTIVLLGA